METLDKRLLDIIIDCNSFTSKQLADKLGISEKTARERLKRVELEVRQNGGAITSKPGKGHQLQIVDNERFTVWCEKIRQPAKTIPVQPKSGSATFCTGCSMPKDLSNWMSSRMNYLFPGLP